MGYAPLLIYLNSIDPKDPVRQVAFAMNLVSAADPKYSIFSAETE
jgi:hypothetical protein